MGLREANKLFPFNRQQLTGDVIAGITVAFLLLPQSMAYAQIAGVPVVMGLYAAAFPLMVYALLGSSKYLSVGPVSIVSLLTFSGISGITGEHDAGFLEMVILLALLVGVMQISLGIMRVGSLFRYVPAALIRGFMSAVALIIIFNQLGALLGVSLPGFETLFSHMAEILRHVQEVHLNTLVIGIGSIIFLIICKKIIRPSPGPFLVVLFSIMFVDYFNLGAYGVNITGRIPVEEFTLGFPIFEWNTIFILLPLAFVISLISFLESYAVARSLAEKDEEEEILSPNRELIGLGASNMMSSMVGGIPIAGAISRSAVAHESGTKTKLALFITAGFMLLSIYFLTPLFYYLPEAALAAIIIMAVYKLIDVRQFLHDCRYKRNDAMVYLITFLTVLFVDVFLGFVVGLFYSSVVQGILKR